MYISGGEDFDQRVMEHFIKLYKKKSGKDIRKSNRAVQKLRREVEKAKRALSAQHQARIEIESFYEGEDFSETLTRAKFEELNMDLFRSTMKPVQKVMEDADLAKTDINEIVLVGGSTRIPKIQQLVKEFFNGKVNFCRYLYPQSTREVSLNLNLVKTISLYNMKGCPVPQVHFTSLPWSILVY